MDLMVSLVAIGFTEYEAKIYLELLRNNPATGYQLAKEAGVPRSMVYESLGRLRNRGAVMETREERATFYRPLPPDVLLENHEQQQRQMLEGLSEGLRQLYLAPDEDHLWTISGQQPIFAYAKQMIRAATESLMLVLPDLDLGVLRDDLFQAERRGIAISALLTGEGRLEIGQVAHHPPLESEIQHLDGMTMLVADNHEVLIASTARETSATITRNQNLVGVARQFIWMELFTQRVYAQLGSDLLARLSVDDRRIFESLQDSK